MSPTTMLSPFTGTHLARAALPYPLPPYKFEDNQLLRFTVRTTPDLLRALVPEPLTVNPHDLMILYGGRFNIVAPLPLRYLEAGIMIPVSYVDRQGVYMPILYVDQEMAIRVGREIWGFPKVDAQIEFEQERESIHLSVARQDTALISASLKFANQDEQSQTTNSGPSSLDLLVLKKVPSATASDVADVEKLNVAPTRERTNREVRSGEGALHLGATALDPLSSIPLLAIVESIYSRGDFIMDYGEVLYDYLV